MNKQMRVGTHEAWACYFKSGDMVFASVSPTQKGSIRLASAALGFASWKAAKGSGVRCDPVLVSRNSRICDTEVIPFDDWVAGWIGDPPMGGFEFEYRQRTPLRFKAKDGSGRTEGL